MESRQLRVELQTNISKELEGEMGIDMIKGVPHSLKCKELHELQSSSVIDPQWVSCFSSFLSSSFMKRLVMLWHSHTYISDN